MSPVSRSDLKPVNLQSNQPGYYEIRTMLLTTAVMRKGGRIKIKP